MTDTDRQSIREGRDTYAAIVPRPSRFANEGRDYRAWADRADAWAKASKGDADAAATLPLSDWAEARRDLMTPQTVATNHELNARSAAHNLRAALAYYGDGTDAASAVADAEALAIHARALLAAIGEASA